jgi:hypothetical protein
MTYVDEVAARLGGLSLSVRGAALDDLRAALAEGATEADLGTPSEYAAAVRAAFVIDDEPQSEQGTVFGVPYETRGATDAGVRGRIWAPSEPRILVPRLLGLGWTVNLGAVAVRLGLLRPDDWDDETLDAADPRLLTALRYTPAVWAAVAVAVSIRTWRRGEPVPTQWSGWGRPEGWSAPSAALLPAALAAGFAAWAASRTTGDDRMIRPAVGAAGASMCATIACLTAASAARPERTVPAPLIVAVPAASLGVQVALPVVTAMRARWRR